ncbi:MAG: response regulator [Desulfobacterales bacterium]|nr:response regulator [Desulfobacterales bacterium]
MFLTYLAFNIDKGSDMRRHQNITFKTKLYLGYATVLSLLIILSAVVYLNLHELEKDRKWVDHTYQAIEFALKSGALLVDMETGVRGFLASGQEQFLEPYQAGMTAFETTFAAGKAHTSDNPRQTRRWDELKAKQEIWLNTVAKPAIEMRWKVNAGQDSIRNFEKISSRRTGKEVFDELRKHLAALDYKFVHDDEPEGADLVMVLLMDLLNQETGQRGFLLTGHESSLEPFNKGLADFDRHYKALMAVKSGNMESRREELREIKALVDKWHEVAVFPEIKARREVNKHPVRLKDVAALLETGKGKRLMDEMRRITLDLVTEEKALLTQRAGATETRSGLTTVAIVAGTLLATLIGLIVSFFIVRTTTGQLGTDPRVLLQLSNQLAQGDLSVDFDRQGKNLSGVYAAFVKMTQNMKSIVEQAQAVARGDYSREIKIRSGKDQLGEALFKMTRELSDASDKNQADKFLRTGQASLNEKLRGEKDLLTISDTAIRFLAEYLGAQVGAFYLLTPGGILQLSASYAYKRRKSVSDKFSVGEGLVGQAAREEKPIVVSEVPEDYIHVTSGLGNTAPGNILVYPVMLENRLKGVIELGSVQFFSDLQIHFLDTVAQSIAVTLQSAESRDEMKRLLEKTQDQAEDLQTQQEELSEANEILETQKKALVESEKALQEQQEELRQTNEELEEQTQLLEEQKEAIQKKNTELEKTRQLIEEKAKDLELTSKYKSEFLANMSHELRTPLNSILLLSGLLSDNKEKSLTPKQKEYAGTIHLSGTELLELINEILDLSKIESGKMEINLENISLRELAGRFERTFKPQAENKNLDLFVEIAQGMPERIRTDSQRLEQILKNLVSNALKFTRSGSISLKVARPGKNRELTQYNLAPKTTVAVSVSDTGEGIPEDKQRLIFEAFQQADGTTSRKYGGSGLGLSISRELARLLGGVIRLQSTHGSGSTFTLYLPEVLEREFTRDPEKPAATREREPGSSEIRPPEESPAQSPPVESVFIPDDRNSIQPGDKTLLIIEDDSRFAKTLSELARERQYKVLVAGDGETGLHFADYYTPNAIILDIGLPGMDGWSVMDRLKEHPETRHIPVHFISAHDKSIEARKMGAIGFITKPVTIPLLDSAFEKIEYLTSGNIKKLLVIEDDETQRKAMIELIGNGDVTTTESASGKEALELIKNNEFDCIILDIGLPDMSGVEFLTHLKEEEETTEIPIIVYTGKELTPEEEGIINEYTERIIIKGARSAEKLIDETTLFLHRVEADLPEEKRKMIRVLHDRESVFQGKKILVVDDDMRNVYALTNVLEEKGLDVLAAQNGRKGVSLIENDPDINLVLMDIMMPEMNGYEAIKIIREKKKFKSLPIIALTAKAMKGDKKKCIEAGASDYLAKPVNTDKLLSMMRVWLY